MKLRLISLLLGCALVLGVLPVLAQDAPEYVEGDCVFELPDTDVEITCGILYVPENHDDPASPLIELPIAILTNTAGEDDYDPVIYFEGGPGGSALAGLESWLEFPLIEQHDLILIEQRGTGYALPSLNCYEYDDPDIEDPEAACADRLREEGVDLSNYNSRQSASDVAALLGLLSETYGYEEYNLYGVSYGTRLALTIIRDHAANLPIRSVVLDGVYPPEIDAYNVVSSDTVVVLGALFAGCAADEACAAAYPDLEQMLYDTVTALNEAPAVYESVDFETGESYENELSGDGFINALTQIMYSTESIPYIPLVIADVFNGDYSTYDALNAGDLETIDGTLQRQDEEEGFIDDDSEGYYNTVECVEEVPFNDLSDAAIAEYVAVLPQALQSSMISYLEEVRSGCEIWQVAPADPIEDELVVSDLPVLIMNGEYDPTTPVSWGFSAAEGFSNPYIFTFPAYGHAVTFEPCADEIMFAFLNDPSSEPDSSCLADVIPYFVVREG
jgi:pimeloyl-ACP methyl ester carboxylesterase